VHPGGAYFIRISEGRDCTVMVNTYHKDPELLKLVLKKYEITEGHANYTTSVHKTLGPVPPFLFPPGFDANTDMPKIKFSPTDLQPTVKQKIKDLRMKPYLKLLDSLFYFIGVLLMIAHMSLLFVVYKALLPSWLLVLLYNLSRTCIAAIGHYAIHSKLGNKFTSFFDFSYIGISFAAVDGHILHHTHTRFGADVKITFFNSPMTLPRLYRFPIHTIHRFGLFLTGLIIRGVKLPVVVEKKLTFGGILHNFLLAKAWLYIEFVVCVLTGNFWMWFAQFTLTLWWNMFLIVSSHSLEPDYTKLEDAPEDWGVFQVEHSYDLTITGNDYVDSFLTAGLSPHRAHHLLPFQKSPFANIAVQDLVREEWEKRGHEWKKPYSYFRLLPSIIRREISAPPININNPAAGKYASSFIEEHFSLGALSTCVEHVLLGFIGEGAV